MSVEGRGWVTHAGIDLVNRKREEPAGLDGRRQLSLGGTSRVSREAQARFREGLGVKFPGPTRLTPVWAFVWNLRTWLAVVREKAQAVRTARPKVPMRRPGADCSVVAVKRGNSRGAKGAGHLHWDRKGQRATGGTRWSRWKAAAFNGWHEPCESRGSSTVP